VGKPLASAVVLLLCFSTTARAGPAWREHSPAFSAAIPASNRNKPLGSVADYVQSLNQSVTIAEIGASVRDGRAKLLDGHEMTGAEVTDVEASSPAATAGIESASTAAAAVFAAASVIPLLQAIDESAVFGNSDLIFAADGERIRNVLDLVDRVEGLPREGWIYLTIARRGRRVQVCVKRMADVVPVGSGKNATGYASR
jgi:S1-C subfamily serine protease